MMVTSTSAPRSVSTALSPPKPPPMTTTLWRGVVTISCLSAPCTRNGPPAVPGQPPVAQGSHALVHEAEERAEDQREGRDIADQPQRPGNAVLAQDHAFPVPTCDALGGLFVHLGLRNPVPGTNHAGPSLHSRRRLSCCTSSNTWTCSRWRSSWYSPGSRRLRRFLPDGRR